MRVTMQDGQLLLLVGDADRKALGVIVGKVLHEGADEGQLLGEWAHEATQIDEDAVGPFMRLAVDEGARSEADSWRRLGETALDWIVENERPQEAPEPLPFHPRKLVYGRFKAWCMENGIPERDIIRAADFYRDFEARTGAQVITIRGVRGYRIGWRDDQEFFQRLYGKTAAPLHPRSKSPGQMGCTGGAALGCNEGAGGSMTDKPISVDRANGHYVLRKGDFPAVTGEVRETVSITQREFQLMRHKIAVTATQIWDQACCGEQLHPCEAQALEALLVAVALPWHVAGE